MGASPETQPSHSLSTLNGLIACICPVLVEQASKSHTLHGVQDYSEAMPRLAEAFATTIGDRRGPFRSSHEKVEVLDKLSHVGWGFLYGIGEPRPNNRMINEWALAVIDKLDAELSK